MLQRPTAIGLTLCELAIREEGTRKLTLVNCFKRLRFSDFPSPARAFWVCAKLTEGLGKISLTIGIASMETMEDFWSRTWNAEFTDPVKEAWFLVPVACSFPTPSLYHVSLRSDDDVIAQTTLEVLEDSADAS